MQANRNIHQCQEKRLYTGYPAAKHPKHSKFAITDTHRKTSGLFLLCDFSSGKKIANLGFFAKVSFPVGCIIPWSHTMLVWSCGPT